LNILAIDTSSDIEFITLRTSGGAFTRSGKPERSHSVDLVTTVDSLLNDGRVTIRDIDIFAVGIGPGSFTGIRIAVSTTRMMAQVTSRPLVGIPTPLLYAVSLSGHADSDDSIIVALDARKNRVFGAVYRGYDEQGLPLPVIEPGDHPLEALLDAAGKTRIVAAGSGIIRFKDMIMTADRDVHLPDTWLDGDAVCDLVEKIWNRDPSKWLNPLSVLPLYARKSDAETARGR